MYNSLTFHLEAICILSSFPGGTSGKEPANAREARDASSIPGSGRSPGGGHGNSLQHCCLENPKDTGAWWATVHRVAMSWTQLKECSTHTHTYVFSHCKKITLQMLLNFIIQCLREHYH